MLKLKQQIEKAAVKGFENRPDLTKKLIISKKAEIAQILSPELSPGAARLKLWRLLDGSTKSISIEIVPKLCQALDCTPNDIF